MSRRGDGIAKVQGFIIFVPGTHQGDQLRVKITSVKPRFATGEPVGAGSSTSSGSQESEVMEEETEEGAEEE
jgi:tRNA/tmRNA/rRNA uracil-C5-methylase (TrmA/RlmC/RlmD family)